MHVTQNNNIHESRKVGEYIGTVNTQGRVTIPEEVRRTLSLHPQDKIVFRVTADTIEIPGKLPTLEELAGSVQPLQPNKELGVIIKAAKAEHYSRRFTAKMQL
jgi:AbrB family looped-hinge helix DNA binding protein